MTLIDHNAERVLKELKRYGMTRETYRSLTKAEDFDQDACAIAYARWLAKRDGKRIPRNCGAATARTSGKISAVLFFTRKRGKPRTIEIPNWNWTPTLVREAAA